MRVTGLYGTDTFDTFEGVMYAGEKATLVWDRRVVYSGAAPATYSNLNRMALYMYDKATGALIAASTHPSDNVQQVAIPPNYSGRVVQLRVQALYYGTARQFFSLATEENFVQVN